MTQPQSVVLHGLSELQRQHQDVFGMNFKSRAASIEEFNKAVHDALNRVSAFNEETMIRAQHAGFQWLVCLTIFQYIFSYGKVTPVLDKEQIWKIWDKHANVIFQACCEAVSQRRYSDILSIEAVRGPRSVHWPANPVQNRPEPLEAVAEGHQSEQLEEDYDEA